MTKRSHYCGSWSRVVSECNCASGTSQLHKLFKQLVPKLGRPVYLKWSWKSGCARKFFIDLWGTPLNFGIGVLRPYGWFLGSKFSKYGWVCQIGEIFTHWIGFISNFVIFLEIFGLSALAVEAYEFTLVRPWVRVPHHIWRSVHQILMIFCTKLHLDESKKWSKQVFEKKSRLPPGGRLSQNPFWAEKWSFEPISSKPGIRFWWFFTDVRYYCS